MADVKASVEAGVGGVNIYMATSEALRQHLSGPIFKKLAGNNSLI